MDELRPHQKTALRHLDNGKILWGGVGSGKSRVAIEYYMEMERPNPIVVITTAKKRDSMDWDKEFAQFGIGREMTNPYAPDMNDAIPGSIAPLIIDSWNNIHKYVDLMDCFFIFDEQRLVGRGAWVKSFLKIAKLNNWIMLTATPGDTWMDYIPVFIANGFYKNRSQFLREHVLFEPHVKYPKVRGYLGVGKLNKLRANTLVHMPYVKTTVRHDKTIYVAHNEELLQHVVKNRWHLFQNRPIKDITELFGVLRRIVNSDPSRLRAVRKLLEEHKKLVVFYNFDYELEALRGLQDVTEVAEWNGHKHEDIPDTDNWVYLVQYIAGSEAWECIETNVVVFYSLTYSYKMWEQAHGRIDRLNTPFIDLYYYILRSKSFICSGIWQSLKRKQNFQPTKFERDFPLIMIDPGKSRQTETVRTAQQSQNSKK